VKGFIGFRRLERGVEQFAVADHATKRLNISTGI
jgi:hypothetical protein